MRIFFFVSIFIPFVSCQKKIEQEPLSNLTATVSNNAEAPLACHSTSFTTNYTTAPGKVPPFQFTKTLYSDTRIRSINMLSRAYPNHSSYPNHAYELIGTFSYLYRRARFVGTKQTWEYYRTSTGAAGRRSLGKKSIIYDIKFSLSLDEPMTVDLIDYTVNNGTPINMLGIFTTVGYDETNGFTEETTLSIRSSPEAKSQDRFWTVEKGDGGKVTHIKRTEGAPSLQNEVRYTYAATPFNSKIFYQPTQYAISYEYNLLEVMQWLPFDVSYQRGSVTLNFPTKNLSSRITQSQKYLNHKYDIKRNLLSYTYADNVLQKTTWYCK